MISAKAFDLLAGIEANNNKQWFDKHREDIRHDLQVPFAHLLNEISDRLKDGPLALKGGEKTLFRMNRDVRFSNDKSPYHTKISGVLTGSGSKADSDGLTYLHLDAQGGFIASGFYGLNPSELGPFRDRMISHPQEFQVALDAIKHGGYELSPRDKLVGMPQGYSQFADAPLAEYLKLKSLVVMETLKASDWTSVTIVEKVVKLTQSSCPLILFGRAARRDKKPH
jgi:uncharacterized protein (TIGR02453 family)